MKTLRVNFSKIESLGEIAICLGYFNGLHLGHLALIKELSKSKLKKALVTLSTSPKSFFLNQEDEIITSISDRHHLLEELNIDYQIVLEADQNFFMITPEQFIEGLLKLGTKEIVVGFDYRFGKKAQGDVNLLKDMSSLGYQVKEVPEVYFENEKASTTLVKSLLEYGEIKKLTTLLNREYEVKGKVIKGNQIGQKIGFPTANVELLENYLLPKNGVYGVKIKIDAKEYYGMANVGCHPTIKELKKKLLEVHIFDFNQDIYNHDIAVSFCTFIRDEQKFDSLALLKKTLSENQIQIKKYFGLES